MTSDPLTVQDTVLPAGALVLEHDDAAGLERLIRAYVQSSGFDAWAASGLRPATRVLDALPRIGVYRSWTASMDEGWTRWVLEQNGIPYVSVHDSLLRSGDLHLSIDVLLLPSLHAAAMTEGVDSSRIPARVGGRL